MKLGCDPEIFLLDAAGALRSSVGLIGGSKHKPLPLIELGDGFAVQEDNVAIEFNTPPASTEAEFDKSIKDTIEFLRKFVGDKYGFTFSKDSAARFPEQELTTPAAKMFGCEPDYNAWTLVPNPRPKADDHRLRSCGGHVHVGMEFAKPFDLIVLVRLLDLFLGVPSVLLDQGEERRKLYGGPGAFRQKPYGVEYRTLSNFWIFEDVLRQWVWKNTATAVDLLNKEVALEEEKPLILDAINNNNKQAAQHLIQKYNIYMPA